MSEEKDAEAEARAVRVGNSASEVRGAVVQIEEQHGDTIVGPAYHGPVEKSDVHIHQSPGRYGSGHIWLMGAALLVLVVGIAAFVYLEHERLSARQPVPERMVAPPPPAAATPSPAATPPPSTVTSTPPPPAAPSLRPPPTSVRVVLSPVPPPTSPASRSAEPDCGTTQSCESRNKTTGTSPTTEPSKTPATPQWWRPA